MKKKPIRRQGSRYHLTRSEQLSLLERVVSDFVSENPFPVEFKIRVQWALNEGNWRDLILLADGIARTVYGNRDEHILFHQFASLIRKASFIDLGIDRANAALETLLRVERRNRLMNMLFRRRRATPTAWDAVVYQMQRYIVKVLSLGERRDETGFRNPEPNLKKILSNCRITSGAAVGVHGNATHIERKLGAMWTVTSSCVDLAFSAVLLNWHMAEHLLSPDGGIVCLDPVELRKRFNGKLAVIDYNKYDSVPKTAKTERGIAVEPLLNLFIQTGIDAVLREKLRRIGIDLSDQGRNQRLVVEDDDGGPDGWCTIDLSSASDTLVTELVKDVLPASWYDLLDRVRSPRTLRGDQCVASNRFASMGNGFCFPLQTLIFAAVCHVASRETGGSGDCSDFAVYGDDIIVRRRAFNRTLELLRMIGCVPNPRKTFGSGPFKESCGVDAYNGQDVRPAEIKQLDTIAQVYSLHNQFLRRPHLRGITDRTREGIRRFVGEHRKYYFVTNSDPAVVHPLLAGETYDCGFWVGQDAVLSSPNARFCRNTQTWYIKVLRLRAKADPQANGGGIPLLWAALNGASATLPFVLRRSVMYSTSWFSTGGVCVSATIS